MGSNLPDPRPAALAGYLYQRAAAFSMSADVADEQATARAGMALLDAATIAAKLLPTDERLTALSEAGCFEPMPDGTVLFMETAEMRAAIQRPLFGEPMSGQEILNHLVDTVRRY